MTITTIQQAVIITEVGLITVGDIVDGDEENQVESGMKVREIRVLGEADGEGQRPLLYTLRLVGATTVNVQLNAPAQVF